MSFRAIASLLTRRFSGLTTGDRAAVVAATALAGGGTLAVQYFKKCPDDDESASRKIVISEEDMKAGFEDWMKKNDKMYRDEEEKAMRFQLYKATIKWIESQPPSSREKLLPENYFADFKPEETPWCRSCINDLVDPDREEYRQNAEFLALHEKGGGASVIWKPNMKQGDKQAT